MRDTTRKPPAGGKAICRENSVKTPVDIPCLAATLRALKTPVMANTKSAEKRARQIKTRTAANKRVLTAVKTQLKKTRTVIDGKDKAAAQAELNKLSSILDKAVKSGRLHKNAASRHKSKINSRVSAL
jgi:small subunit ribosomal protein S20